MMPLAGLLQELTQSAGILYREIHLPVPAEVAHMLARQLQLPEEVRAKSSARCDATPVAHFAY